MYNSKMVRMTLAGVAAKLDGLEKNFDQKSSALHEDIREIKAKVEKINGSVRDTKEETIKHCERIRSNTIVTEDHDRRIRYLEKRGPSLTGWLLQVFRS